MQSFPQPLLQALGHRVPNRIYDLLYDELDHRTPAQLFDRIERRWHTRWSHAIHERDEDNRRRWSPHEIAEFLVGRGPCQNPACEDGHLIADSTPCPYCQHPEHRFTPTTPDTPPSSEHARRTAAQIRQMLVSTRTDRNKRPGMRRPGDAALLPASPAGRPPWVAAPSSHPGPLSSEGEDKY
ncbi:hypothetical protein ACH4OX_33120 [Streptomyces roseolus]|uniref:hypothetical protein n=1 Tax=Streptomyces roseolus TaxID=67358 RepID=UPI00378FA5EA